MTFPMPGGAPSSRFVFLQEWYSGPLTTGAQVDGTFLPDTPAALLKSGRFNEVDLMVGWFLDDGNFYTAGINIFIMSLRLLSQARTKQ